MLSIYLNQICNMWIIAVILLIVSIIFLVICVLKYISFKKEVSRISEVQEFLSVICHQSCAYLSCKGNGAIQIMPEGKQFDKLVEYMTKSKYPLTLEEWFSSEQICALNEGQEYIDKLKAEGEIIADADIMNYTKKVDSETLNQ